MQRKPLPLGTEVIKSCVCRAPVGAHCATHDSPQAPQKGLSPVQVSFYLSLSGIAGIKAATGIFLPANFLGGEPLLLKDQGSDALGGEFA